ncbi:hypothetical protein ASE46_29280 [Bacillus sp. Root239]|nr:hypothetical protein ASE46_29280 [Bacillus sp. Root239]
MACCNHCNYKWNAKNVWLLGFSKKGKKCPKCSTRQFVSFKGTGPLIGLGYLSGIIAILFIIFFLFLVKLTDKEDATWQ